MEEPEAVEVERAALGAAITSPRACEILLDRGVGADDFALPNHQTVFDAIRELSAQNRAIDSITVREVLRDTLPPDVVSLLVGAEFAPENQHGYVDVIKDCALRRRILATLDVASLAAKTGKGVEALSKTLESLGRLEDDQSQGQVWSAKKLATEALASYRARKTDRLPGAPWPVRDLTNATGGLRAGRLYVLAGYRGLGKTALLTQVAHLAALEGKRVGIFSYEMTSTELADRLVVQGVGVSPRALDWGGLDAEDELAYERELERLSALELFTFECHDHDHMDFIARKQRRHKLDLVCVDYLQKMAFDSRYLEAETARQASAAKALARNERCAVLLLSQLSNEGRVRNSGQILDAADCVIMIERSPGCDTLRLNITKQRHGVETVIECGFKGERLSFED